MEAKMFFKKLIIGTMLLTGSVAANATTHITNLGELEDGDFGLVGGLFVRPQSFSDVINFTLTSTSSITGFFTPFRLQSASWSLSSASRGLLDGGALSLGSYSFADLSPGSYSVSIFGDSRAFGFYAASYRVAVAAVPEMETWLMLLLGAGLVAFQLHRKQKTLSQQALPDGSPSAA
jgi:hypothetical protein